MKKNKKQAAAVAAVMAYLAMEAQPAETLTAAATETPSPGQVPPPAAGLSPWGLAGRQAQMHLRALLQMKAFHGGRLR